ncbi:hypothetical protein [Thalassomonas actiniarum]|uniref:Uncharacterized protein n=1 Tax=Thalassomonas actiniarum TaxID=485447 RepID=A0AAF0C216_9GAMM|nr:hypothetical protein [Thalassomonas actiniarum]WDD97330.1 hypothetical protein SG35_018600 [Thalassomonas actiniarum]
MKVLFSGDTVNFDTLTPKKSGLKGKRRYHVSRYADMATSCVLSWQVRRKVPIGVISP